MRLRIRRRNGASPAAQAETPARIRASSEEQDFVVVRPPTAAVPAPSAPAPVPPFSPPIPPPTNGLRAQATPSDARAERLVRAVRMELEDLKQSLDDRRGVEGDLVEVDLAVIRANPRAAATLPPAILARALATATDRIAALEREIVSHQREESALRDQLTRLQDEHSYIRGRTETLHDVVAALHGNLEDLRYERERRRSLDPPPPPPALPHPGRESDDPSRLRDQRGSCP